MGATSREDASSSAVKRYFSLPFFSFFSYIYFYVDTFCLNIVRVFMYVFETSRLVNPCPPCAGAG